MRPVLVRFALVATLAATLASCSNDSEPATPASPTLTSSTMPFTDMPTVDDSVPQDVSTSSSSIVRTAWDPFSGVDVPFVGPAGPTSIAVLVADTEAKRSLGLMNRTDLGGYDGMVFAFENDTTASFYMKNTKIALTIIFFTADGKYVSQTDMTPCTSDPCPLYGADAPYRYALEVMTGTATELGLVAGVTIDWSAALRS